MKRTLLGLVLGVSALGVVHAADLDPRWYLAPTVNYTVADTKRNADDGWGLGLALGKQIAPNWNLEGVLHGSSLDRKGSSGSYDVSGGALDLLYFYNRNPSFAPYAVAGLGALHTTASGGYKDNSMLANIGLGFLTQVSDNIDLRADARYRWSGNDGAVFRHGPNFSDWLFSVGVQIALGDLPKAKAAPAPVPAPAPAPAPVPVKPVVLDSDGDGVPDDLDKCPNTPKGVQVDAAGCPLDTDGDGVPDYLDRCPNTPKGAKVDANGCPVDSDNDGVPDYLDKCPDTPAGVAVDANGCPADSDNDGVPDYLDKCPDTPAGAKVDAKGCPLDSDNDGVPDYLDKCPDTPAGDRVDNNGCPLPKVINLKGVNFDNDKAILRPDAISILDDAVATLQRYPALKVEIAGHTDSTSTARHNLGLSERRAKAVMDFFVSKGIAADRLTAKGYGQTQPVGDNKSADGRTENRRVELRLQN